MKRPFNPGGFNPLCLRRRHARPAVAQPAACHRCRQKKEEEAEEQTRADLMEARADRSLCRLSAGLLNPPPYLFPLLQALQSAASHTALSPTGETVLHAKRQYNLKRKNVVRSYWEFPQLYSSKTATERAEWCTRPEIKRYPAKSLLSD